MKKKLLGFIVVAISTIISIGVASKSPNVTLVSKQFKVVKKVDKRGHIVTVLKDVKKVIPGDTVLYRNIVSNFGDKALKNIVLNNDIPKHTKYIKNSAKCSVKCNIFLSTDGGRTFKKASQVNPKKTVTNIRWVLLSSIASNKKATVSYAIKIK